MPKPVFFKKSIAFLPVALLLCACGGPRECKVTRIDGFTQGSTYRMTLVGDSVPDNIQQQIDSLLREVEQSLSLYNPNSLLSRINRNETDSVDALIIRCIAVAEKVSRETDGIYDVTIKPVTSAYGFTGDDPDDRPDIDSLMQYVGYEKIAVRGGRLVKEHPGMQLDLNSVAQGVTADYVSAWLDAQGVKSYLIEIGSGEIFARGTRANGTAWRVGVDRPVEGNIIPGADLMQIIRLHDGRGMNTSGNYRKFRVTDDGRKVVHTIDARTGQSVISNLLSATVIAEDSALADAYGTAFMAMGLEPSIEFLKQHPELEGLLIYSDEEGKLQVHLTPGMRTLIIK